MRDYEQLKLITNNYDMNPLNRIKLSRNIDEMACEGIEMFSSNSPPSDQEVTSHPVKRRKRSKYCDAIDKICDVCGDVAKSMHFGGMACDSCKAFFRRSVQNDSYKTFKCGAQKSCPVIKDNRRICQYCRFQKCLSIGMEVKWVMSEGERMNLWKSKISKQRDKVVNPKPPLPASGSSPAKVVGPLPVCNSSNVTLTPQDQATIEDLVLLQELVFSSMPYPKECVGDTQISMTNLFYCICQKIRCFFSRLEDYRAVSKEDQIVMLRNGVGMSIYLHGAYNYDVTNKTWPASNIKDALRLPPVSLDTLKMFTVFPVLYKALMEFYDEYGHDLKDEVVLVLLCIITLFHDTENEFKARAFIQGLSNRYITLLRNYLQFKNGRLNGDQQLTRLLDSLFSVKKITSYHTVVNMKPPSVKSDQIINTGVQSLMDQVAAISQLLNQALISGIPKYSSALSPIEKVDLQLMRRKKQLIFTRPQLLPDPYIDFSFHHPLTNALLGSEIKTDKLLSFCRKNIFSLHSNFQRLQAISDSSECQSSTELPGDSISKVRNDRVNQNQKYDHYDVVDESCETHTSANTDYSLLQSEPINHSCHSFVKQYKFPFYGRDPSISSENIY